MVDVCDMTKFPPTTYFDQHEIPIPIPTNYDYEYTRAFVIRAEGATDKHEPTVISEFNTLLLESVTTPIKPGVPKNVKNWEKIAEELIIGEGLAQRNPLDFAIWSESRVIILLQQKFWKFSPTMAALTTKYNYGEQYFDLRRHAVVNEVFIDITDEDWRRDWSTEDSHCISFYTKDPCRDWQLPGGSPKVTHGFSLNLEVLMSGGKQLPITIDPDIENKGGHP